MLPGRLPPHCFDPMAFERDREYDYEYGCEGVNRDLHVCDQRPEQCVRLQLRQIHLLVFDEAHHCVSRDPGNVIMQQFYHSGQGLKVRRVAGGPEDYLHVLPLDSFGFGSITLQTGA